MRRLSRNRPDSGPVRLGLLGIAVAALLAASFGAGDTLAFFTSSPTVSANTMSAASCQRTEVRQVQKGTVSDTTNGIVYVTINAVDLSKAYLIFNVTSTATVPGDQVLRGRLTGSQTLEFERATNTATPPAISVQWYVVEYTCGVKVQRGETTINATTVNQAITPVASLNQAFVLWSGTGNPASATWDSSWAVLGDLTGTSNLQFRTSAVDATPHIYSWQVVEFVNSWDVDVQRGTVSWTSATNSQTVTLARAIDTTETFVLVGFRMPTVAAVGQRMLRGRLASGTTVQFNRGATGTAVDEITYQVVNLQDGTRVQYGSQVMNNPTTTSTATLPLPVNLSRSIVFASTQAGAGQSTGQNNSTGSASGVSQETMAITSQTQVTFTRGDGSTGSDVDWYVLDFSAWCGRAQVVQSGTAVNSANGIQTVNITWVDPTTSYLVFQAASNSGSPPDSVVRGRLADSNTLQFERVTSTVTPPAIDIQWYVVSYLCGVKVQRGDVALTSATLNVPITPVSSMSHAFVLVSRTSQSGTAGWGDDDVTVADLTSTSNLQLRTVGANANTYASWQVIEFTNDVDASVQRGSTSLSGANLSVTATLPVPVDTGRSFVLASLRSSTNGTNISGRLVRAQLTNATTVTIDRATAGAPDTIDEVDWQVVQLGDGSKVQSGNASFAAGTATATATLTAVDTTRTIAFSGVQQSAGQSGGQSDYAADDQPGVAQATMAITSATQLTLTRSDTNGNANIAWSVIELTGNPYPTYNITCVSDDSARCGGNCDNSGYTYSYQALAAAGITTGGTVTSNGMTFTFPNVAGGYPDAYQAVGERVLATGSGKLSFLGMATSTATTGTFTITFTDGTTQSVSESLTDWHSSGGVQAGNVSAAHMTYRNNRTGAQTSFGMDVWSTAPVTLTAGKTVASITFPNTPNIKVFAWSIA